MSNLPPSLFLHQDGVSQAVVHHEVVHIRYLSQLTGHPRSISRTDVRLGKAWDKGERSSEDTANYRKSLPPRSPSAHTVSKNGWFRAISNPKHGLIGYSWALLDHVPPHCRQHLPPLSLSLWELMVWNWRDGFGVHFVKWVLIMASWWWWCCLVLLVVLKSQMALSLLVFNF